MANAETAEQDKIMKKALYFTFVIILISVGIYALVSHNPTMSDKNNKIVIVTTLFPLYDSAQNIGGDKVEVSLLLPPGVEPHSFDPKPSDIAKINKADIFIFTGKFMEPWAQDIINGLSNKIVIVDSSTGAKMIPAVFHDKDEPQGAMDPHIWLDFDNDKIIVDNITNALCKKDSKNANYYKQNADKYKNSLTKLDSEYKTVLTNCKSRTIVYGGHYAFGYLANRYGLKYLAAQGISPDAEPTAQDLIRLIEHIKNDNISYIFYEELTSPKIAETLAEETQAKMLLLNAGHNITRKDFENKVSFFSIMESNLKNLKTGLGCD